MPIDVSVVVPVYNVEKYLEKCLLSLTGQTLDNIEIIVVNDGSPDNSQAIIDSFAEKFSDKIVAVRQDNMGLGEARNTGVRHARGEYVGFVDSDDYVDPDMFRLLYESAERNGSDVVICDFYTVNEITAQTKVESYSAKNRGLQDTIAHYVLASVNPAVAWNKLYKRHLLEKTNFPTGWFEDVATTPIIISNCKKISVVPQPLYYYLMRDSSITSQRNNPKTLDILKGWMRCLTECNVAYKNEMAYAIYFSICFYLDYKSEFRSEFYKFFSENETCFKDNFYIGRALAAGTLPDLFNACR